MALVPSWYRRCISECMSSSKTPGRDTNRLILRDALSWQTQQDGPEALANVINPIEDQVPKIVSVVSAWVWFITNGYTLEVPRSRLKANFFSLTFSIVLLDFELWPIRPINDTSCCLRFSSSRSHEWWMSWNNWSSWASLKWIAAADSMDWTFSDTARLWLCWKNASSFRDGNQSVSCSVITCICHMWLNSSMVISLAINSTIVRILSQYCDWSIWLSNAIVRTLLDSSHSIIFSDWTAFFFTFGK